MVGPKNQDFWPKINSNPMKVPNLVNLSADRSPNIRHDFSNKEVQKRKLSKNSFNPYLLTHPNPSKAII